MAESSSEEKFIGSIDIGTSSTRFTVYSNTGETLVSHQTVVPRLTPHPEWIEQDATELIESVGVCLHQVTKKLNAIGRSSRDVAAIGLTNQRETLIVWDKETGKPLYNAIIWCDNRNAEIVSNLISTYGTNYFQKKNGLTLSTYFTATKISWLRQNVPSIKEAIDNCTCYLGTVDSYIIYCLTGGKTFATDVSNASRTFLMNINTLQWDDELCQLFHIPKACLPEIRSSAEIYGTICDEYKDYSGIVISGVLGDQQASLVGTGCTNKGNAKITYGTGCFLLYNTGTELHFTEKGLITTVAYKMGKDAPTIYALEGSVATCGLAVQWLSDILDCPEIPPPNTNKTINKQQAQQTTPQTTPQTLHELASSVENSDGVYFVPAFSGLFCPYWKPNARGCLIGLTAYSKRGHIARAVLEGVAFQAMDVLNVTELPITEVRVDGGLSKSNLLLQFQADVLGISVKRPSNVEATSRGAAIAAAIGSGLNEAVLKEDERYFTVFTPKMRHRERRKRTRMWKKAIQRSMDWVDEYDDYDEYSDERRKSDLI